MTRKYHSFIWSGLVFLAFLVFGIVTSVNSSDYTNLVVYGVLGVLSFTLLSCLILKNNFIGEMLYKIFSWGFVKMPGLIFTLDLDGIIWFLTVKLLFWILGMVLVFICGALAITVGLVVSLFVYPIAIYKNIKYGYIY